MSGRCAAAIAAKCCGSISLWQHLLLGCPPHFTATRTHCCADSGGEQPKRSLQRRGSVSSRAAGYTCRFLFYYPPDRSRPTPLAPVLPFQYVHFCLIHRPWPHSRSGRLPLLLPYSRHTHTHSGARRYLSSQVRAASASISSSNAHEAALLASLGPGHSFFSKKVYCR
jgi:hypothetical protein